MVGLRPSNVSSHFVDEWLMNEGLPRIGFESLLRYQSSDVSLCKFAGGADAKRVITI